VLIVYVIGKLNMFCTTCCMIAGNKMMRLQKGMLKFKLISKGVACHSGYPECGKSAVHPLVTVLNTLQTAQWPSSEVYTQ
jgi:acetylornithine deacetylase/succinyl-diaminopimelate desuccinylase-like protein